MKDKEDKKRKGFPHKEQKHWRKRYYRLLEKYNVSLGLVGDFGDILEIIQGEIIAPEVNYDQLWMGGPACNGEEGTLDLILQIPSLSKQGKFYKVVVKLDRRKNMIPPNRYNIIEIPPHYCEERGVRHITRLPGPCHHIIGGFKALQYNLPEWCLKKGIEERHFQRYKDLTYWLREKEPEEIINLFKELLRKRTPRLEIRRQILDRKMELYGT